MENTRTTVRLLLMKAFQYSDPELTAMFQELYIKCPSLFDTMLPRSEIESLNNKAAENLHYSADEDDDEVLLQADNKHTRPSAIGCIEPGYIRRELGFPVSPKDLTNPSNTAFADELSAAYDRDYTKPYVMHFGKVPLAWCKKLSFFDP